MTKPASQSGRHGLWKRLHRPCRAADNAPSLDLRPGTTVVAADGVVLGHVV